MGGYGDKGTDISKIFFPIKSLNCDLLACSAILHPSTLVFLYSTSVSQCLPSTVLRRFIRASTKKLKELMERRLDTRYLVATIIDVKRFKDEEMIIALGSRQKVRRCSWVLPRQVPRMPRCARSFSPAFSAEGSL